MEYTGEISASSHVLLGCVIAPLVQVCVPQRTLLNVQPVGLSSSSSSSSEEVGSMAEEVTLTVKYLSSPRLLRLQLQDAALRRHFLVQVGCLPYNLQSQSRQSPMLGGAHKEDLRS